MLVEKKKVIFIVTLVLLICVSVGAGFFLYKQKSSRADLTASKVVNRVAGDEAGELKKNNADSVAAAINGKSERVRGIDANDYYMGKLDAPVQLIVYNNFECSFCIKYFETIQKVIQEYPNDVAVAFRHFVLREGGAVQRNAMLAANALECAGEQGKFWEMEAKLYADGADKKLNTEQFHGDAQSLGIDVDKFDQCLQDSKYATKIDGQMLEAKRYEVSGTPASFLNGVPVPGAIPFDDFSGSDGKSRKGIKSLIDEFLGKK